MTKRRFISFLPAYSQTQDLTSFFGGTVDEVFQPGDARPITGYIGHRPNIYGAPILTDDDAPKGSTMLEFTKTDAILVGQSVFGINIDVSTIVIAITDRIVRLSKPITDIIPVNSPIVFYDAEFYVEELTASRDFYQLESGMVSLDDNDVINNALTYPDLIHYLDAEGAITTDHQRLFETDYYSWAPPTNIDMLINYLEYYWFGDATGKIEQPILVLTIPINHFIGDGHTTSFALPKSIRSVAHGDEDATIYVNGIARTDFSITYISWHRNIYYSAGFLLVYQRAVYEALQNHTSGSKFNLALWKARPDMTPAMVQAISLDTAPALGSNIILARVFDFAQTIEDMVTVDVSDINDNNVKFLSSGMRLKIVDLIRVVGSWDGSAWDYDTLMSPPHPGRWDFGGTPFFIIDGVGASIRLTPETNLIRDTVPQYVTIDRSSRQRNDWSNHNGWVHKDTYAWSNQFFPHRQAKRPIIEFVRDLVMYPNQVWAINKEPLFMLYDLNGHAYDDPGFYPNFDFKGNRIFSFMTNDNAPFDPILNLPLKFDVNGYIMFQVDTGGQQQDTSPTGNNIIVPYTYRLGPQTPTCSILSLPCYQLDDGTTSEINPLWHLVHHTTTQDKTKGFYNIPLNLQANPNSLDVTEISQSTGLEHYSSIIAGQTALVGQPYGNNSYRDTLRDLKTGNVILQHRAPLLKTMLLANNINFDLPQSILYIDQEYNKFRNKFIRKLTDLANRGTLQDVDPIADPDAWVHATCTAFKHDKNSNSPFASNRVGGDQYFIPPTPTALGILPATVPTMVTNPLMIQGHDGSLTPAFNDWRDNVLLQLETIIYNNLPDKFKTDARPVFDIQQWIGTRFYAPQNGYTRDEFALVMTPMFELWAQTNGIDYHVNNDYDPDDPFSWNYHGILDRFGNSLPGHWRAIYQWYYGTDTPQSRPWEMLGFIGQPTWWQATYGSAPYTRNNTQLWYDLENGIIKFGVRSGTDKKYARPGLADLIPVDVTGRLLDPVEVGIVTGNVSVDVISKYWITYEGPTQATWYNTPSYRYSLAIASFLMKPARFVEECWDTINLGFIGDQWVGLEESWRPFNRPQNSVQYVYGETASNGTMSTMTGISQWISDYLIYSGKTSTMFGTAIRNLDVHLMYPMAGFVSLDNVKVVADNFGLLPLEDIHNILYNSPVISTESYSGVVLQWTGRSWQASGYDIRNPFFTIIPPDLYGPKGVITLGENEPKIIQWHGNTYYPGDCLVVYQNSVYESIRSHTSGPNFELMYWKPRPDLAASMVQAPRVITYQKGLPSTQKIPYGTEFTTYQDIANFLLGWERWLTNRGWIFDTIDPYSGQLRDWSMAVKDFLTWAQVRWAPGNFIALSPGMHELKFSTEFGEILNVESNFVGFFGLIDRDGKPISSRNAVVNRLDGNISIVARNIDIFSARLQIASVEHTLVFNNITIFQDIVYLPLFNQRQPRLRLMCDRSNDWTGRMDAPGFIIISDNLKANFEKAADDLRFMYDIELSSNKNLRSYARHVIGLQHRDYFENLLLSDTQQIEFYQGMIQQKGAPTVFNKLMRSNRASNHTNLYFLEEWAIRTGKFGQPDDPTIVFQLTQTDTRDDPQIIQLTPYLSAPLDWIELSYGDVRWIEPPKNPAFFPMVNTKSAVPTAGPVRVTDVQFSVFRLPDLQDVFNTQKGLGNVPFPVKSLTWVYERNDGTFTVLRSFDLGTMTRIISQYDDSTVATTRILFAQPLVLNSTDVGARIVIDGHIQSTPDLDGLQIISLVTADYIEIETICDSGYDFTTSVPPTVRVLREIRFLNRTALSHSTIPFSIGDLVWIDQDTNGLWAVLQWNGLSWGVVRAQPLRCTAIPIVETLIYEHRTTIVDQKMFTDEPIVDVVVVIDPLSGIIAGVAEREIDYKTEYDPARYNAGIAGLASNPWGPNDVGRVWWDLSTVKFIDPFTDVIGVSPDRDITELHYRKNHWNDIAEHASVDVYEWIESDIDPVSYINSFSELGEVYNAANPSWVEIRAYHPDKTLYYFWVKGLNIVPDVSFRHMSINTIALAIENPSSLNLPWMAPIYQDTLIVSGVIQFLDDIATVMKVRLTRERPYETPPTTYVTSWEFEPDIDYGEQKLGDFFVVEDYNNEHSVHQYQKFIDCNFTAPDRTLLEDLDNFGDVGAKFTSINPLTFGEIYNNSFMNLYDNCEYVVSGQPLGPNYSVQFRATPTLYDHAAAAGINMFAIGRANQANNGYMIAVISDGADYFIQLSVMLGTSTQIKLGLIPFGYYQVTMNMSVNVIYVTVRRSCDYLWLTSYGDWMANESIAISIVDTTYQAAGRVLIGIGSPTSAPPPSPPSLPNVNIAVGGISVDLPHVSIGVGDVIIDLPNVSIGIGIYNPSFQVLGVSGSGQVNALSVSTGNNRSRLVPSVFGSGQVNVISVSISLPRLSTSGNRIVDSNGSTVILKGVNWNGGEGSTFVPLGLWQRDYKAMIDQIVSFGMNCIRLPLSCAMNDTVMNSGGLVTYLINTDLISLTALQIIDKIIDYAGSKGIWVFLDCHRVTAGNGTDSALSAGTLAQITTWWQTMATRYAANPTVCGADLYNEPYTVDWNTLAGYYEQIGNAIHAIAPNWLILCEGGTLPVGAPNGAWWGAALSDWAIRPVSLTIPNKVVASPHEYGHSVSLQVWLESTSNPSVSGWPTNLDTIWANNWGYLHTANTVPILIGEYGGRMGFNSSTGAVDLSQTDASYELQWFNHLIAYMTTNGISSTFWTLTSESGDTGGLLNSDDATVQSGKFALMSPYLP